MKCPNCNVSLVMSERSGIEIDYCPECRGIWLDRGELDKIIERSATEIRGKSSSGKHHFHSGGEQGYNQPYKQKNWLSELFD